MRASAIASSASVVSRPEMTWQISRQANRPALASGSVPGRKPLPAFAESYAARASARVLFHGHDSAALTSDVFGASSSEPARWSREICKARNGHQVGHFPTLDENRA